MLYEVITLEDLSYELNVVSARLARESADQYTAKNPDKPRFVAGSIGPTNKTTSLSPDVNDPGYRAVSVITSYSIHYTKLYDSLFLNLVGYFLTCNQAFDETDSRKVSISEIPVR